MILPAALFLALLGAGLFRAKPALAPGSPAPAFSLPLVDDSGSELSLSDLRGRPVVLNFWASWCLPCRDEAPELARTAAGRDDVVFVGVNILDGRDEALDFVEEYDIGYRNVRDASGAVARRYRVTGVPETVFVDADGRFVGKFIGDMSGGSLPGILDDLVRLEPDEVLRITGRGRTRPVP